MLNILQNTSVSAKNKCEVEHKTFNETHTI